MKLSNEAKVGMMVTVAVIMLVVLTVKAGNFRLTNKGSVIKVHLMNVDGVSTNSPVMFNGLEVGLVKAVDIKDEPSGVKMELSIWLEEGVKIHQGASAYVKNMGFMGEKYIGLTGGNAQLGYLMEGDLIIGQEPADLDRILLDGQAVVQEIKSISTNINARLSKNEEAIDRIFTNADHTMVNLASITDNVNERLTVNEQKIDEIVMHLHSVSANLDLFTADLKENPWKLLHRTKEQKANHREEIEKLLK